MNNNQKTDYIKELIRHLESIKDSAIKYATFDIIIISFTLANLIFGKSNIVLTCFHKIILSGSILSFALSALFFVIWAQFVQIKRVRAINLLLSLNIDTARKIHHPGNEFYKQRGWLSIVGAVFLSLGILCYLIFVFMIINF